MSRLAPLGWAALGGGGVAAVLFATGALTPQSADAPVAAEAEAAKLAPDTPEAVKAGVKVAPLVSASTASERKGFARALDISPLAVIDGEIRAARAAAGASAAEAARLRSLYAADQSASLRSLQAVQAQASADRIRVEVAQRRVAIEYGPGLARIGTGIVGEVASGRAALVRIDIAGAPLMPGQSVRIGDAGEATVVRVLGASASADARLQTPGALALVRGPAARGLLAGRIVPAAVAGGKTSTGVLVPRAAIVRWQGARWVYRQHDKGFERVELIDGQPVGDGWLVTQGLAAGDRIAVEGVGSLLAAERSGEAGGEE